MSWWEMPAEETKAEQKGRYVPPAWTDLIENYLKEVSLGEGDVFDISVAEILKDALSLPAAQWSKSNEMRVAESLRYLGWQKRDVRRGGSVTKRWEPPRPSNTGAK